MERPKLTELLQMAWNDREALAYEGFKVGLGSPIRCSETVRAFMNSYYFGDAVIYPRISRGYRHDRGYDVFDMGDLGDNPSYVIGFGREDAYSDQYTSLNGFEAIRESILRVARIRDMMPYNALPAEFVWYGNGLYGRPKTPTFIREKIMVKKPFIHMSEEDVRVNPNMGHEIRAILKAASLMESQDNPVLFNLSNPKNVVIGINGSIRVVNPHPLIPVGNHDFQIQELQTRNTLEMMKQALMLI